jgi:probable HAF family extracellular repeat protein
MIVAAAFAPLAGGARADYIIKDLGVIPGGTSSQGLALNSQSAVTGYGDSGGSGVHAFIRFSSDTSLTDLGTLGGSNSHGLAINAGGVVVGDSQLANTHSQAFFANGPGSMTAIPMNQSWTDSFATGVNNASQISGYAFRTDGTVRAFVGTTAGNAVELGTLGGRNSHAYGINNNAVVVGAAETSSGHTHAFVTSPLGLTDLGGLGASDTSVGLAINDSGEVVGYGGFTGSTHAFRYIGGAMQDLGTLSGTGTSAANAVNSQGDLVGSSSAFGSTSHAFIFYASGTDMLDLNDLVENGAGWILTSANGINDMGQIVGTGTIDGQTHAYLLTLVVVPEPSTWFLSLVVAGGFAAWSAKRIKRGRTDGPAGA